MLFLEPDNLVQVRSLSYLAQVLSPRRLQHLNQDVVVHVLHEMSHLVVGKIEFVVLALQVAFDLAEGCLVRHVQAPAH